MFGLFKKKNTEAETKIINKLLGLMSENSSRLKISKSPQYGDPIILFDKIRINCPCEGLGGISAPRLRHYPASIEIGKEEFLPSNTKAFDKAVNSFLDIRREEDLKKALDDDSG